MRVTGKHRTSKVEGPRIAGFGLMMVGAMALVLSVAGAAGAGSGTPAATPAHHTCGTVYKTDGQMAQVLQSVENGNCGWNTTTTYKKTGCTCMDTTTTVPETTTTPTTMVEGTTVDVTTVPATTTATTMPATTAPTTAPATTDTSATTMPATTIPNDIVVPQGGGDTTTSLGVKGISTVSPQASAVAPASDVLPFTGSNTMPLAIAGLVMLATGFGLTRTRKRRVAR